MDKPYAVAVQKKVAEIQLLLKNSCNSNIGKELVVRLADILSEDHTFLTDKKFRGDCGSGSKRLFLKQKTRALISRLDNLKDIVVDFVNRSRPVAAVVAADAAAVTTRTPKVTLARLTPQEIQMNVDGRNGGDFTEDDDSLDSDNLFEPVNVKVSQRHFNGFNTSNLPEKRVRKQILRPDFVSSFKKVKMEEELGTSQNNFKKIKLEHERDDVSSSNEGDSSTWRATTPTNSNGSSNEFPCPVCKKIFRKKGHMTRHLLTHEPEKPFGCDFCPKRFAAKYSLQMHLLNRHNTDAKPFECEHCDKRFTLKKELDQHMASHKKGFKSRSYPCHLCELKFIAKDDLDKHLESHPEANIYNCGHCDKTFPRRYNLIRHERTHSTEKPFHCDVCNKDFGTKNGLHLHLQSHEVEDQKPLVCNLCDKRFTVEQNLELHISYHNQSEDKPFSCELCEVRFKSQERLDRHFETHGSSEGRVYPCQYCEKTFPRKYNLVRHELSHTHGRRKPKDGMPMRILGRDSKSTEDGDKSDEENVSGSIDENSMPPTSMETESVTSIQLEGNQHHHLDKSYSAFNDLCKSDLFAVLFGIGGDAFDDYEGPSPFSTEQYRVLKFENY